MQTVPIVVNRKTVQKEEFLDRDLRLGIDEEIIHDKWLYLFYSKGSEYAIRRSSPTGTENGEFVRRVLHPEETGGQTIAEPHIAAAGGKEVVVDAMSSRTFNPIERAEHVKFELYFVHGKFYFRSPCSRLALNNRGVIVGYYENEDGAGMACAWEPRRQRTHFRGSGDDWCARGINMIDQIVATSCQFIRTM